jgi:hypothetical protein
MYACAPIHVGESVVVWGGVVFTRDEVDAGKAEEGSTVPTGEGIYLGSPAGTYNREKDDLGDFMNHSCDPNVLMQDEVTLIARQDIAAEEELTTDYALWEDDEQYVAAWECCCGSSLCRHRITGGDWRHPELQRRYEGHFSPFINERIKKLHAAILDRDTALQRGRAP